MADSSASSKLFAARRCIHKATEEKPPPFLGLPRDKGSTRSRSRKMPALVVFGRRSRVVGSDDLYFPALVLLLFQLPLLLLCVFYVSLWRRCSSLTLDETGLPFWYMLGAIPVVVFMACANLMIMHVSAKGTMVDHERRMVMPRVLHVHVLWSTLSMAYGLAGVSLWYCREMCYPDSNFVLVRCSLGGQASWGQDDSNATLACCSDQPIHRQSAGAWWPR